MPLENMFGWTATNTSMAFSIAIFVLGLSAAILGRVIEKYGPSKGGLLSAIFFSIGLFGSGLAVYLESLWLFFLFFGLISGIGLGLGYISPVSTLVKWFPDRRGLATGLAIMGFGFGGLVCAHLIDVFNPPSAELVLPQEVSVRDYVDRIEIAPEEAEAMIAGVPGIDEFKEVENQLMDLQRNGEEDSKALISLQETIAPYKTVILYEKSKIVTAFIALGIIYLIVMLPSAMYIASPPADYIEQFDLNGNGNGKTKLITVPDVNAFDALKTPGI